MSTMQSEPHPRSDQAVASELPAVRAVLALSWASLVWMTAEGVLGLYAGVRAHSVSLVAWALGSAIEGLASVIVIWRFTGTRRLSGGAEQQAQRTVAVSFWLLAAFITAEAFRDLVGGHTVETTTLGIAVAAASVVVMPALGVAKKRLGTRLHSGATAGEGTQNLMCAAHAAVVLAGLAVHAATDGRAARVQLPGEARLSAGPPH